MADEILDDEELEAIMSSAEEGSSDAESKYDLARQDYAVQRLMPALSVIHNNFSKLLKDRLRQFLPSISSVSLDAISMMSFEELSSKISAPCSISCIRGLPFDSSLLLAFESDLVFQLVDIYFGGFGTAHEVDREHLSSTEITFMEVINDALLPDIGTAWQSMIKAAPTVKSQHADLNQLEEFSPVDSMVTARFLVNVGEFSGGLWVVVPWSVIDAVRESLTGTAKSARKTSGGDWQLSLERNLECAAINMVAVLSESRVSLKRVASLKVGEVLEISAPEFIYLKSNGTPYIRGKFGTHKGNYALNVDEILIGKKPA